MFANKQAQQQQKQQHKTNYTKAAGRRKCYLGNARDRQAEGLAGATVGHGMERLAK